MNAAIDDNVLVPVPGENIVLEGILSLPDDARGLVIFAHGSGSSRHSPRNRYLADELAGEGFATLLFDLLTNDEAADRANVFDIALLTARVIDAVRWARKRETIRALPIGLFGASTGAAAALSAAAALPDDISAVVSRGGRPDMAMDKLRLVKAPTLLIVGGSDHQVIKLNEAAYAELACKKHLRIVPGATHLFEEPGTLEAVARHTRTWFATYLAGAKDRQS